jgi:hypothetical protein
VMRQVDRKFKLRLQDRPPENLWAQRADAARACSGRTGYFADGSRLRR